MSFIRTQKRENPFVQVDKHVLDNDGLSYTAKGLMAYILSKPDTWTIRTTDLIKRSKDGKTKIETALLELMAQGYLNWYQLREENGTMGEWVYDVYERPEFNPESEKFIKEGKLRIEKRAAKNNERNTAKKLKASKKSELIEPKVDNQLSVNLDQPKVGYPVPDNPVPDNQRYSNNELELNIYSSNKEEEEEEESHRVVVSFFEKNIATSNAAIEKAFKEWVTVLPMDIIMNEIDYAAKNNAHSFSYLEKALQQDLKLQIDSIEKLENKRKEHASKKGGRNSFTNRLKKDEKAPSWIQEQKERRKQGETIKDEITPEYEQKRIDLLNRLGIAAN